MNKVKSHKLKILHVTGTMNRGGAEVMLMDMYRNISEEIHFDFLVNYTLKSGIVKGNFDDEIFKKGGRISYIPTQWGIGPLKYAKAFKKRVEELGKPDVVHIHLNAKSGVIAWAASKAGINKIIVHSHANLKFRGSRVYVILSKLELHVQKWLISKYATNFWGCSEEANTSLFYSYLQTTNKCVIIKNAVDVQSFQDVKEREVKALLNSYKVTENTLILGNVGRVVKHKNVVFIIDILKELVKNNIDFKFIFAGRTDDKEYMQEILEKINTHKIKDKVLYLGERSDIQTIVNTFDVFVGPALKEGFGLVAVEAQAAGVPCVLYTGFPKSVDMGLNLVTYVTNFEVEQWVAAILRAQHKKCSDKNFIKSTIVSLGFDIKGNVKQIEQLYNK